jgi:cellulose synthase/poly-beta-1,6-N-acetylglucosamine synthase-like glycosyltransferase
MIFSDFFFIAASILLLIPVGVVCVESLGWLVPKRRNLPQGNLEREPLVVLIPAHNEEKCLAETLRNVKSQLRDGDQILVVADNCVDQTSQIARDAGAEVIERVAPLRRGKGHALSFGVEHIKQTKRMPRVTIVVDADCTVEAGAIEALAARVIAIGRPVQAMYLLEQSAGESSSQNKLSWMAFLVRNGIRPGGANRLGLPCHLTGSGMAFPWHVLSSVTLDGEHLVEDMQFGVDLAIAGSPAALCEEARILRRPAVDQEAARAQQARWEHGHLVTAVTQVPQLVAVAFRKRKLAPLTLALDLCVPPLSLLAVLIVATFMGSVGMAFFARGTWLPMEMLVCGSAMMFFCLTVGCASFGQPSLPGEALLALPTYIKWKLPIYRSFVSRLGIDRIWSWGSAKPAETSANPVGTIAPTPSRSEQPQERIAS